MTRFEVAALDGIPEVRAGDDLAQLILDAYAAYGPEDGDILVVTSKVVSKAEGRIMAAPDRESAIDQETVRVVATVEHGGGRTRIVENRQGLVLAAAGVDASNADEGTVLLLPVDPDASARALAQRLRAATGKSVGVVVSDTLGRPWRVGQTDHAIGAAGVRVAHDLRGERDSRGRLLEATIAAVGDELAAAGDLVKGKASQRPVAVVRGLGHLVGSLDEPGAHSLQRPAREDLFRLGAAEAWRAGYEAALATAAGAGDAAAAGADATGAGPGAGRASWTVVIPVKGAGGKSRLGGPDGLASAIAADTIAQVRACAAVARIIVVGALPEGVDSDRVEVVADPGAGLTAAVAAGVALADGHRAVLLGDLPALDARELEHALTLAETAGRAFVPDADGEGSVLATARPGLEFAPAFGPESAEAHRRAGFTELHLPASWGLRRDVDTRGHLTALADRLGPRTRSLIAEV